MFLKVSVPFYIWCNQSCRKPEEILTKLNDGTGTMNSTVVLICRFFQKDEELLILTQSDELSRTYDEDKNLPFDQVTNKSTSCNDTRRNQASFRRDTLSLSAQGDLTMRERPAPNLMGSTGTLLPDGAAFKETRATLVATRPKTITTILAVSTADSVWLKNTNGYDKGRKSSGIQDDMMGSNSEENHNFNQNQGNKRKNYRAVGILQKQRPTEDGEDNKEKEEPERRTSQFCTSVEEERTRMRLANPVQSPNISTTSLNPSPTITTWEAGWNVTNAIQVPLYNMPTYIVRNVSHVWKNDTGI